MINAPELPNSAMNRWLAFIHLFNFTVVHIAGAKHIIPDLLSRVERTQSDTKARSVENFIGNLGSYKAREVEEVYDIYFLEDLYEGEKEWINLGRYLDTLERDKDLSDQKFARLRDVALKHYLKDGRIMKPVSEGDVEVMMDKSRRTKILFELHGNLGHRGCDETYRRAKERFWWPGMSEDVRKYVKSCVPCQLRSAGQERERKKRTMSAGVFSRIHFDCVHLGKAGYLVSGRDNVNGWVEARIIKKAKARVVAAFMDEDVISRYGLFGVAVVDGGSEFRGVCKELLEARGIRRIVIAAYASESSGRAERGHQNLVEPLVKITGGDVMKFSKHLHLVLLADQISVSRATSYLPYELVFGVCPVLPIDVEEGTWLVHDWEKVQSRKELLTIRAEILARKEGLVEEEMIKMDKARAASIAHRDRVNAHRIREPLKTGDLVLALDQAVASSVGMKHLNKWDGPMRVVERLPKGSYLLAGVDGAIEGRAYPPKRLKRLFSRARPVAELIREELRAGETGQGPAESADSDVTMAKERAQDQPMESVAARAPNKQKKFYIDILVFSLGQ
ncbi:hypothetical protein P7C70_g6095, partial [Phenoliferia sp. Uapishka_3]